VSFKKPRCMSASRRTPEVFVKVLNFLEYIIGKSDWSSFRQHAATVYSERRIDAAQYFRHHYDTVDHTLKRNENYNILKNENEF